MTASFAASQLCSFASRVERLDGEIAACNSDKKELYAEMKAQGFDVKAFKAAHRRHLQEQDDPAGVQEADAVIDIYLAALKGADTQETKSGANVAQVRGHSDNPSRARAREASNSAPVLPMADGGADGGPISVATTETPSAPVEPETLSSVSGADPLAGEGGVTDAASPASEGFPEMPGFLNRKPTASDYLAAG